LNREVKTMLKLLAVAALASSMWLSLACGSTDDRGNLEQGKLLLRSGASMDDAQECGLEGPQCPEGLICATFTIENGPSGPRCINPETVCEKLQCTAGQCMVRESYPAQLGCGGTSSGPDSDKPVSNNP
jgi:hypothetical protein